MRSRTVVWVTTSTKSSGTYIASAGETWDVIALKVYVEERMASTLIQANPRLAHIVVFEGGEQVRFPVVTRTNSPASLPPWRR